MNVNPGKIVAGRGGAQVALSTQEIRTIVEESLKAWGGPPKKLLILPPDMTRLHSGAGEITCMIYELCQGKSEIEILPAIGTHAQMTKAELEHMFPGIPLGLFREHDWRGGVKKMGEIPSAYIKEQSEGHLDWPVEVLSDNLLADGGHDLVISIGQVVPHEVVGLANQNKNVLIGVGGTDFLNKSHFIGAVYGMERMMGRSDTPVRRVFDYAENSFLSHLPIKYMLTVKSLDDTGKLQTRGLFCGEGKAPFNDAAVLSQRTNLNMMDAPIQKAVVYLDPQEFKSTWLGNKAIYRLRMAMATGGELIILGPGVHMFGEDPGIDKLIRKYGYHGTPHTLDLVKNNPEMGSNLSVAAHLIHGSSEGRFKVVYGAGGLSRQEVEGAGFEYAEPAVIRQQYPIEKLQRGYNDVHGEKVFYVDNPALGLWALASNFD